MKKCTICKQTKELTEFNNKTSSKDGKQPQCRSCGKDKSKQYYRSNEEKHKKVVQENKKSYIQRNRNYIFEYLKTHPCVDCGILDIRVLEFDHKPDTIKVEGVATLASKPASLEILIAEINKCEVRCRNHHAIKTYERLGGSWHNLYLEVEGL